jgi:hypothetical protein
LEQEYWEYVDRGQPLTVEYASDLDVAKVGSGFGTIGQKIVHPDQPKYVDHPWNLNNIAK